MTFIRKFLYHTAGVGFKLLLLLIPVVFASAIVLSSPKYIENALKESRVYDQFVSTVIDNSKDKATNENNKKLLSDPDIKAAAEKSFSPALLQSSTENVINGIFAWMQGKTTEPEFRIDLTNAKAELSTNVAAYAEKRANGLPQCTLQQLRQMDPNIDFLEIPCVPPGVNVHTLAQEYSQKFLADSDFLSDPVITNETIAKNNDGKSLSDSLSGVPKAYSTVDTLKWILLALTIGLGALLVFARRDRRAGVKHLAWALLGVGTFLVIELIIYWFLFDRANAAREAADTVQAMWIDGAKALMREFNKILVWFSAIYLLLGAGLVAWLRMRPTNMPIVRTNNKTDSV
jgi:hypothetical protein